MLKPKFSKKVSFQLQTDLLQLLALNLPEGANYGNLPCCVLKKRGTMGIKIKQVITLCFKCKLSVKNSRPIFFLSTQQKSLWCLDNSTNHLGLNTFQLPCILTTNISTLSWKDLHTWLLFNHLSIEVSA